MLIDSTTTFSNLTIRVTLDTDTDYISAIKWSNSDPVTYIFQVYNEVTKGRYNYQLSPTTGEELSDVDGYLPAARGDIFFRIVGVLPPPPEEN